MLTMLQKLQKLRKMHPHEIGLRARRLLRLRSERRDWRLRAPSPSLPPGDVPHLLAAAARLVRGGSVRSLAKLERLHPALYAQLRSQTVENCRQILAGEWSMLGRCFDLQAPIDWHRDPATGYEFPQTFHADVPLHQQSDTFIDVKYVWELGRHQYVAELAHGWLLTQDDACARRARQILLEWIPQNPLYTGVHWTSGLEVAVRAISWLWTLGALAEWPGWSTQDIGRIAASLSEHAVYLEHHFSFYTSPYNHLVGEACGLYLLALALPGARDARRWRTAARDVLAEHGPRQFYSDGFCVEQATGYHFFSLGFLALAMVAAERAGEPLSELAPIVHRAFRAGAAFRQPTGEWPPIGDVDSARALPVHPRNGWDFSGLCSLAAVMFEESELKNCSDGPGAELYWLLGCPGVDQWTALNSRPRPPSTLLPEAGYAVHQGRTSWVLLDAGPIAHGLHADGAPSTAHGHLDLLQVLYSRLTGPVLIDSGMPFYFGAPAWVRRFRGAAAHNTLEVEDVAWARDAGGLAWSHVTAATRIEAHDTSQGWTATGVVEAPGEPGSRGISISRTVAVGAEDDAVQISDCLQLDRPRAVRWHWQLADGLQPRILSQNPKAAVIGLGDLRLSIHLQEGETFELSAGESSDESLRGMRSRGYGECQRGTALTVRASAAAELRVSTRIDADPAVPEPDARSDQEPRNAAACR